jgi:hypothetical protein
MPLIVTLLPYCHKAATAGRDPIAPIRLPEFELLMLRNLNAQRMSVAKTLHADASQISDQAGGQRSQAVMALWITTRGATAVALASRLARGLLLLANVKRFSFHAANLGGR